MDTDSPSHRTTTVAGGTSIFRRTGTSGGVLAETVVGSRRLLRALRRGLVLAWHWVFSTLTPVGWLLAAAVLLALPTGLAFGFVELVLLGIAAAVLLLLAVPFLNGAGAYEVDLSITEHRVVAGTPVRGATRVKNGSGRLALPGLLDIPIGAGMMEVPVPMLRSGAEYAHEVEIPTRRRGIVMVGPVTSVRGDPLGILRREHAWQDRHELYIHPVTVRIPSTSSGIVRDLEGQPSGTVVDSDLSFHAIREYVPGDAQKHIHWKTTAKLGGTLMVRQYEETRRSRLAVVLDLEHSGYADAEEKELAISAAGSLAVRAIRDSRQLAVVVGGPLPELSVDTVASLQALATVSRRTVLDELSRIDTSIAVTALDQVCQLTADAYPDLSIVFVVSGSALSLRRLQTIATKFPANVTTVAVVCNRQAAPSFRVLGGVPVITVALLEDLRKLLSRRVAS